MGKIILILFLIFTLASFVYAASLKKCNSVKKGFETLEVCEPANPIGKFMQDNFGFTFSY